MVRYDWMRVLTDFGLQVLIYDIQLIIGGRYEELDSDMHLLAAIRIFCDMILMLLFLVEVLNVVGE